MKMVPEQREGASSATTYIRKLPAVTAAKEAFEEAKANLLNVNDWHKLAGKGSAVFQVVNYFGEVVTDAVKEGNYLRITIPEVPGSPAADGNDWVKVERIKEYHNDDYECVAIRVRPAVPPFEQQGKVAHFFSPEATSTFSIERHDRFVIASVNGRNETPNIKTRGFWARVRNFFVALGAMAGLNKSQWKRLAKGLLLKRVPVKKMAYK